MARRLCGFEIYLEGFKEPKKKQKDKNVFVASKYQSVERDFAFVVDKNIKASQIISLIKNCPADRFKKFNIDIKERNKQGKHILVCPSSYTIQNYIDWNDWHVHITDEIKEYTDRPIVWRDKPRKNGTSGPAVAEIPIEEQLKDAWACVTSCSISAVEAIAQGVPVFCHPKSFAAPIANTHLKHIENPVWNDPTEWYHSLCYQQFTPEEYNNGTAVSILKDMGVL